MKSKYSIAAGEKMLADILKAKLDNRAIEAAAAALKALESAQQHAPALLHRRMKNVAAEMGDLLEEWREANG